MAIQLHFGTAGIRATLGPGEDQLNPRSVRAVAHAITCHLNAQDPDAKRSGLCVAYDGRSQSDVFAREVIEVALAMGYLVRAFEAPEPTPLLAYSTRRHDAAAGIMITASHNPPTDNGIKVYLRGGIQIAAPHDREIAAQIAAVHDPDAIAKLRPDQAPERYVRLGEDDKQAYLTAIAQLVPPPDESVALPRIAYSALCGVGGPLAARLFAAAAARDVVYVAGQRAPRADFAGLAYPNPESPRALTALVELAESADAQLAIAHDPDADRLALLARDANGVLRQLSGDEVGALLGWFLLEGEPHPEQALLVSTFVSGGLLEAICRARGAHFSRTHTGFKWIASRARELRARRGLRFLFGYEEAIGYAFGALGDDKDGLAALYVLCALTRSLAERSQRLTDLLDQLARSHGLYASQQLTIQIDPRAAAPSARALFEGLRRRSDEELLGPHATRQDYSEGPDPVALLIIQDAALRLCVRPSGTEPKLKLYLHGRTEVAAAESAAQARARLDARLAELGRRLSQLLREGSE